MNRDTRNILQKQQKGNVQRVKEIDMKSLYEGETRTFYIEGSGLYDVIRFNNQIWYSQYSTSR